MPTIAKKILADCLAETVAQDENTVAHFEDSVFATTADAFSSILEQGNVREWWRQLNLLR